MENNKPDTDHWDAGADRDDNVYGSDFAFRMNQIEEKRWNRYAYIGGAVLGALMAGVLFLSPDSVADSLRLLIGMALALLPIQFLEKRAERSLKPAKKAMAIVFCAGILCYAGYLLLF